MEIGIYTFAETSFDPRTGRQLDVGRWLQDLNDFTRTGTLGTLHRLQERRSLTGESSSRSSTESVGCSSPWMVPSIVSLSRGHTGLGAYELMCCI